MNVSGKEPHIRPANGIMTVGLLTFRLGQPNSVQGGDTPAHLPRTIFARQCDARWYVWCPKSADGVVFEKNVYQILTILKAKAHISCDGGFFQLWICPWEKPLWCTWCHENTCRNRIHKVREQNLGTWKAIIMFFTCPVIDWLMDWLIDWWIVWLVGWSIDGLITFLCIFK